MSDEPTTIDWNLHMTRGHTPMSDWHKRNSLDHYYSAEADEWLVKVAPMFREEVIRLREIVSVVEDAVKTHNAWSAGTSETFVIWDELAWQLSNMLYGGEEE